MADNFKKGDVVVCLATEGFHGSTIRKYPRLYGPYVIDSVLTDAAVILEDIDKSHANTVPASTDLDFAAFWPWNFKKAVGLKPKSSINSNGCEKGAHELVNIEI